MKSGMFISAMLKMKNLAVLLILLGLSSFLGALSPVVRIAAYVISLVVYLIVTLRTLSDKKFLEEYGRRQKVKEIQDLNFACLRLANEAKQYTNAAYQQKLRNVMEDKDDIVNSFFRGEHSFLKEKIVEQTLKLVVSYLRLLTNFCMRSREINSVNIGDIAGRINANIRKLNFSHLPEASEDIKKSVELDEKLLNRVKEEKRSLEQTAAKLDYMETTVNLFKHQILASVEREDMLEELEKAVNEAQALDTVLDERRRNKINV